MGALHTQEFVMASLVGFVGWPETPRSFPTPRPYHAQAFREPPPARPRPANTAPGPGLRPHARCCPAAGTGKSLRSPR